MSASIHSFSVSVDSHSHSNSSHLGDHFDCVEHFEAPSIHLCLPVREPLRDNLREVIWSTFGSLSNFPHESPLCIKHWHDWRNRQIFGCLLKIYDFLSVIPCHFDIFWCCSSLVVILWFDIVNFFTWVEELASLFEVLLHQVNVDLVVDEVNSRVFDQKNSKLMKAFSDFLALESNICAYLVLLDVSLSKVNSHVNDWDILKIVTCDCGVWVESATGANSLVFLWAEVSNVLIFQHAWDVSVNF